MNKLHNTNEEREGGQGLDLEGKLKKAEKDAG